jgi:hypothetical protein
VSDYNPASAYEIVPEPRSGTGEDSHATDLRLKVPRKPPTELLTTIGDALHNLRSCLDSVAFAMRHTGGTMTEKQQRAVQFPQFGRYQGARFGSIAAWLDLACGTHGMMSELLAEPRLAIPTGPASRPLTRSPTGCASLPGSPHSPCPRSTRTSIHPICWTVILPEESATGMDNSHVVTGAGAVMTSCLAYSCPPTT